MGAGHDHEAHDHHHGHDHAHGHHHGHGHHHHHHGELPGDAAGLRRLAIAFALNFVFTIAEVIGGLWTNSMAILADALHDLGDTLALGLALAMQSLSRRGRDGSFSYGYRRFSLLAALVNSAVLSVGAVFIFFEALPRLLAPEPVHVPGMIGFAIAGILFNGIAAWQMHGGDSLNEKMVRWHLFEDVLGWIAVLIGALAMLVWDLPMIDALLSIGINLFILWNVSRVLWQTLRVFLQSVPASVSMESLEAKIAALPGVLEIHDTHLWSLDGSYHVLTLHLVIAQDSNLGKAHEIKCAARAIANAGGVGHATIEVEREQDDCALSESQ